MKLLTSKFFLRFFWALFFGFGAGPLGAADRHIDVSRIFDKAAAESVLGATVTAPAARNIEGKDGYYSKCNYYTTTPGRSLIIRVYQAGVGFNPYKELEQVIESSGSMRAIPGLGDKARMSTGAEGGLPLRAVMLYVVKGNALLTVGLGGLDDEAVAQEKIKEVAQKILAEL